ncbi:DUF4296 domain-containing protein [Rapidithrix thailandica]|uniref:DUF4296 domain-containing protein n=1 Tax=Rapidithrix thailandica TaxID=413964 RepID=A0AAW9S772_9BACT
MKRVLPLFLLLFAACSNEKLPEGVLDHKTMIEVLADRNILEVQVFQEKTSMNVKEILFDSLFFLKLQERGIDTVTYKHSDRYYNDNPQELQTIYKALEDTLNQRMERIMQKRMDKGDTP